MPVVKDLVPDLTQFYAQYAAVKPWLVSRTPAPPDAERLQSKEDQEKIDRPSACILCACCSTACPSYWWNSDRYLGPAALLAAYRWIIDSRDESTGERLDELEIRSSCIVPHDHELHRSLSEGPQPGQGDWRDQADDRRTQALTAPPAIDRQRVAWRCRRGMKELDLILNAWLVDCWPTAGVAEKAQFERFLELPDPVIAAYLLGRDAPDDPPTRALIEQLRKQPSG